RHTGKPRPMISVLPAREKSCLFDGRIEREIAAEAFFFGDVEDLDGDGEVPGGDAVGFEESVLGVGDAPGDLAGDELREFVHSVPAFGVLLERDDEVTRLCLDCSRESTKMRLALAMAAASSSCLCA